MSPLDLVFTTSNSIGAEGTDQGHGLDITQQEYNAHAHALLRMCMSTCASLSLPTIVQVQYKIWHELFNRSRCTNYKLMKQMERKMLYAISTMHTYIYIYICISYTTALRCI